jgi:hypothetical protein
MKFTPEYHFITIISMADARLQAWLQFEVRANKRGINEAGPYVRTAKLTLGNADASQISSNTRLMSTTSSPKEAETRFPQPS